MPRQDGLPNPATVTEMYLAAILDELRGQGKPLIGLAPVPEENKDTMHVKESNKGKNRR